MKSFTKEVIVVNSDLDELNHVNNIRYMAWVQEISKEHWSIRSKDRMNDKYFWVVRSHSITYYKPAIRDNVLTIKTYVPESKGPISKRIVEFYLDLPENKIAHCETEWILMDSRTGKPCRIPKEILDLFRI